MGGGGGVRGGWKGRGRGEGREVFEGVPLWSAVEVGKLVDLLISPVRSRTRLSRRIRNVKTAVPAAQTDMEKSGESNPQPRLLDDWREVYWTFSLRGSQGQALYCM